MSDNADQYWPDEDDDAIKRIDLGDGHWMSWTGWAPDRTLNPQYDDIPDVHRLGAIIGHLRPDGKRCLGSIMFKGNPGVERVFPGQAKWDVVSWEPFTIAPSVLCHCGDHGFIREGKWVRA